MISSVANEAEEQLNDYLKSRDHLSYRDLMSRLTFVQDRDRLNVCDGETLVFEAECHGCYSHLTNRST